MNNPQQKPILNKSLSKTPTGIIGLDEITGGGLPAGRPTLICGQAGSGKTLFSMEFIVRGVTEFNEPGVFMAFEEKTEELAMNVASLGFDLVQLQHDKMIKLDYVHIERSEIEETGEYDLDGLFIRLGYAIDSIGAKRVVLDTIENLFSGLSNQSILRSELRRLFQWLKDKNVTAIITGEKGENSLTRQGLEEYVSDCVILLDHRVSNQISTRLLRVIKYRGSVHGTNEYPFLIDEEGISVLPITSLQLDNNVSAERFSTGITALDDMLGGKGFFRGSSILISGTAGTGKTSIAACFANETCLRKERCLYFAFEESPQQLIRNIQSIGVNLQQHIDNGLLQFQASRPTLNGLEMHLVPDYSY
jgi:circadian clock protein KaiC